MAKATGIGIVLSGTAPAMTLMSGAMLAFAEREVEFEVISTTGVGGLIGMLYLAPKGGDRKKALRELKNLFVSDWLYRLVPINFKVFHKYSSLAPTFYRLRKALPRFTIPPDDPSELKRLFNDWMELWATVLTPPSYEAIREAFMSHVPLVEDLVDFDKLKASTTRFYLNAFSLATRRLRIFNHTQVTPDIYNGAQAMFMLFPPVATDHDLLATGATRDPTGLQAIWSTTERDKLQAVLALDPLPHCFWRKPTDAYDAFQLMLMNPIVALQQLMYALYAKTDALVNGLPANSPPAVAAIPNAPFKIPRLFGIPITTIAHDDEPRMLKWTHTNAVALQDAGYRAALPFAERLATHAESPDALIEALASSRFATTFLTTQRRSQQFLRGIFSPMFENFEKYINWLSSGVGQTGKEEPRRDESQRPESRPGEPRPGGRRKKR
jgi:predicted acylesterase/phospholipase RssA